MKLRLLDFWSPTQNFTNRNPSNDRICRLRTFDTSYHALEVECSISSLLASVVSCNRRIKFTDDRGKLGHRNQPLEIQQANKPLFRKGWAPQTIQVILLAFNFGCQVILQALFAGSVSTVGQCEQVFGLGFFVADGAQYLIGALPFDILL